MAHAFRPPFIRSAQQVRSANGGGIAFHAANESNAMIGTGGTSPMNGQAQNYLAVIKVVGVCLLYTSPSPRDGLLSRMPSSA